jgi:4a-hydroxytetrahydrobiopterin dehydratase
VPRTGRNRIHLDVHVPREVAESRVAAALAAGGRMVRDNGPVYWTLADPEGNEVDVAIIS